MYRVKCHLNNDAQTASDSMTAKAKTALDSNLNDSRDAKRVFWNSKGEHLTDDKGEPLPTLYANYDFEPSEEFQQLPEQKQARYWRGQVLESALQIALKRNRIPFEGNPIDISHYPHSCGNKHVDVETSQYLIEATNPKKQTWMNDQIMNEKIDYFFADDPEHKKQWILLTSYRHWSKNIDKRLRDNRITVIATNTTLYPNYANYNFDTITALLTKLFQTINNALNNLPIINKYKQLPRGYNNQLNNIYQTITIINSLYPFNLLTNNKALMTAT